MPSSPHQQYNPLLFSTICPSSIYSFFTCPPRFLPAPHNPPLQTVHICPSYIWTSNIFPSTLWTFTMYPSSICPPLHLLSLLHAAFHHMPLDHHITLYHTSSTIRPCTIRPTTKCPFSNLSLSPYDLTLFPIIHQIEIRPIVVVQSTGRDNGKEGGRFMRYSHAEVYARSHEGKATAERPYGTSGGGTNSTLPPCPIYWKSQKGPSI
jgi:hypothetical protein